MPSFILRKIDPGLWERVKAQATKEGRPLRWVLLRLLAVYATRGLDELEQPSVNACETCGEPAGEGNALCPACQQSR
jgi:hypothetical protein